MMPERLTGGVFYIHAFDANKKKSYFILSEMSNHEPLFNLLFDLQFKVYPSDEKEWRKYTRKKYQGDFLFSEEVDDENFDVFKEKLKK